MIWVSWFILLLQRIKCYEKIRLKCFLTLHHFFSGLWPKREKNLNKSHFYCRNDWFQQNIDTILLINFPSSVKITQVVPSRGEWKISLRLVLLCNKQSRDFLAQKLKMADGYWVFAAVSLVILVTFPNKDAVFGLDNGLALTPPSTVTQFNYKLKKLAV